jgi:hypothetical protein
MAQLRRNQMILAAFAGAILAAAAVQPAQDPAVEVKLSDGFGAFQVVNHGPPISLSSSVEVEQQVNGLWKNARVTNLYLISKCASVSVPKCVPLATGATLQPVPWRGSYCYSQCPVSCDLDGPLPPGTYRFVVATCDGKHHFASPPFEKKPSVEKK